MKNLIFVLSLVLSTPALAAMDFTCVGAMPTTSFLAEVKGTELEVTTIHHNGTAFMPIHEGIIVPNDIPYLKSKVPVLGAMGDRNTFRFPLSACRIDGPGQLSCGSGKTEMFDGKEYRPIGLHTSVVREQAFGYEFNHNKITLSVQIENFSPVQDIVNNFYDGECKLGF